MFSLLVVFTASLSLAAESSVRERRIEEEKRASLRKTEQVVYETREPFAEPADIDIKYFNDLLSRRVTHISDAIKVISILTKADIKADDEDSQLALLKDKKLLPENALKDVEPNMPLRKGVAAYMFCAALEIRGGVIMSIFGLSERYAMKELVCEGMLNPGDPDDIVSGRELALLFVEADRYISSKARPGITGKTAQ